MPRGDLVYNEQLSHGMRKNRGMPPSHNCVWVEGDREKYNDNYDKAFGKTGDETNGGWECTCNFSEGVLKGNTYIFRTECKLHGPAEKKPLKLTDMMKGFSDRQLKKAKGFVIYGKGSGVNDIREITHRNG